jgi:hypothetical protein
MRRSRLVFAASVAAVLAMAIAPASGIGPGGWDRVGHGSTTGKPSLNGKVSALNTERPGFLYAGGTFTNAGGVASADLIAKWNGSKWSAIGSTPLTSAAGAEVRAIAYDDATGKVYAGGTFVNGGGNANADFLAVWDGVSWQPACSSFTRPAFIGNVDALQIIGSTLYVGGEFQDGAELPTADYLLACDLASGTSISVLPTDGAFNGPIYALTADSLGTLYAGGNFGNLAQSSAADYVAAYKAGVWQAMGYGAGPSGGAVTGIVRSLTATGTRVYVGTDALDVAGIAQADHVARWDTKTLAWSAVGANKAATNGWFPTSAYIYALEASGSVVLAGGTFQDANGTKSADMVAFFDGTAWRPIGSDGTGGGPLPAEVHALKLLASRVYAGGNFTSAGGDTLARYLAVYGLGQPDSSVSTPPLCPYVGNGVYDETGDGQECHVFVERGHQAHAFVKIQNDGLVPASFKVRATGGVYGINASWSANGDNITSAIRDGSFSTGILAPKETFMIGMGIFPQHVDGPNWTTFLIRTRSATGMEPDAVKVSVTTYH